MVDPGYNNSRPVSTRDSNHLYAKVNANASRVANLSTPALSATNRQIMSSTNLTSPPQSPLPKRLKTDHAAASPSTMASTTPAVTKVDQAPPLLIKKLSPHARLPTRGSAFAAGYDLYASKETVIPARGKALVDTDISMAVPAGTCKFLVLRISDSSKAGRSNFLLALLEMVKRVG